MPRHAWISPWRRVRHILGLNARNLLYIQPLNPRRLFPLVDDKIRTKTVLAEAGVRTPELLLVLSNLDEVNHARESLRKAGEFVIKPARGRQGGGITVITSCEGETFTRIGGTRASWEQLRQWMGDILFGVHSVGDRDRVLIEERVHPDPALNSLAEFGLPDVRVIVLHNRPAMAMMRLATRASGGRANLHQGAPGIALRLSDGLAFRAVCNRRPIFRHPDNGAPLTGFRHPDWKALLHMATRAAAAVALPYVGVDMVLDARRGPVVMELNARPGLEIQIVQRRGLRRRLQRLAAAAWGLT
ncbi:MAG: sugar-transfer associated ATP-grasp domain-containing protein [Acidobacteriota bacterium]